MVDVDGVMKEVYNKLPVSGLYTFGAPRVGSTGYRAYINQKLGYKHWRFMYKNDIVPDVPLPMFKAILAPLPAIGFSRDGCMLRLKEDSYETLRLIKKDGTRKILGRYNGVSPTDHKIDNYINSLRQLVKKQNPDFPEMKFASLLLDKFDNLGADDDLEDLP